MRGNGVKKSLSSFARARRGILPVVGAFLFAAALVSPAHASGPSSNRVLNYQLRLTDASGIPVADGTKSVKLTFFTASSGGTQLYTACSADGSATGTPTAVTVTFTNGAASVLIGDTGITCASGTAVAIPATLFDNVAMYLGVTVNADAEMTPRKRIVATGYSLNADRLDDLDTSAAGGSNAFVPVTDSSGNFTLTKNVTVDTDTFFVDSANNRVGAGTNSPQATMHVNGTDGIRFTSGTPTSGLNYIAATSTDVLKASTKGSLTLEFDSDNLLPAGDYFGVYSAGSATPKLAIQSSTGYVSVGTSGVDAHFVVGASASTVTEEMKVQGAADAKISIVADTDNVSEIDNPLISFSQDGATIRSMLGLVGNAGNDPSNNPTTGTLADAIYLGSYLSTIPMQFATDGVVRLTISSAGLVGINTSSPATLFEVEDATSSNAALEELAIHRSRADATAPGAADFGGDMTWRLEGATNNSDVVAAKIRGAWEAAQTNDTTDRDSYLSFATMADNSIGERMRINSAGNVGIGDTSPAALLTVGSGDLFTVDSSGVMTLGSLSSDPTGANGRTYYNTTSNKFRCYQNGAWTDCIGGAGSMSVGGTVTSGTTGSVLFVGSGPVLSQDNANFFWDDTNNRLGIGTATPYAGQLQVNTTNGGGVGGEIWITNNSNTTSSIARLAFDATATGQDTTPAAGIDYFNASSLQNMAFKFYDGVGYNEKLRFQSNGNVGIGQTAPAQLLELSGGNISLGRINSSAYSRYVGIGGSSGTIVENSSGGSQIKFESEADNDNLIHFITHHNGVSHAIRMTIDRDGLVGIGDTTPDALLTLHPATDNAMALKIEQQNSTDGWEWHASNSFGVLRLSRTGTSAGERMTMNATGETGFGDTNPGNAFGGTGSIGQLSVVRTSSGATTTGLNLINAATAANTAVAIDFTPNTNVPLARLNALRTNTGGAGTTDFIFSNYKGASATLTETMRILGDSGSLGIGTATPTQLLTIGAGGNAQIDAGRFNTPSGGFGRYENYLLNSETVGGTSWTNESTIAVTADQTSPDGTASAARRVSTGGAGAADAIKQSVSIASTTATWTASVWMKMTTGSATVNLRINDDNQTGTASAKSVTTAWQRFSVTEAALTSSTSVEFRIETGTNTNVVLWGAQLEKQSDVGVYAKTGTVGITTTQRGLVANSAGNHYMASGVLSVGTVADAEYRISTGGGITGAFYGVTTSSTVGAPQIDLQDTATSQETVLTSQDGAGTTGTFLASWSNHPLMFGTNASSTSGAKMTLDASGRLGIGMASPGARLDVLDTANSATVVQVRGSNTGTGIGQYHQLVVLNENTSANTTAGIGIQHFNASSSAVNAAVLDATLDVVTAGSESGNFRISTMNSGTIGERLRVTSAGNVGIGDSSPTALLTVGSGDLFTVDSSGNVDTNAHMAVGSGASTGANDIIKVQETFTGTTGKTGVTVLTTTNPGANSGGTWDGIYTNVSTSGAGANNFTNRLAGIEANVSIAHSGTTASAFAVNGEAYYTGSSTVTELIGVYGAASDSGTGSVTNLYGMYSNLYLDGLTGTNSYGLRVYQSGTPTSLTNNYGIYIDPVAGGTNAYSIYSNGGTSYHSGAFGIGDTTPDAKLDVTSGGSGTDGIFVDNTSTGDPAVQFRLSDTAQFTMGVDNSSTNDDFVISDGGTLGTSNRFEIDGLSGQIILNPGTSQVYVPIGNLTLNQGDINLSNSYTVNFGAAGAGNYFYWKMAERSGANACASGNATEGIIIRDTGGTQRGHICIDGPSSGTPNKLRFYAESFTTGATDLAEMYSTRPEDGIDAGDVVELDPTGGLMVRKTSAASAHAFGVVSSGAGLMLSGIDEATGQGDTTNGKYVALKGRVPVKVSMENGPIAVGDWLAPSSTPGVAMRADAAGQVIGRALDAASADGKIRLFVEVGWWNGDAVAPNVLGGALPGLQQMTQGIDMAGNVITNVSGISGLNGLWSIDDGGHMTIKEVAAEKFAVTQTDATTTIDSAVIPSGEAHAQVHNPAITAKTKVFVTFRKNPRVAWWVDEVTDGLFVIKTDAPVAEDVAFDYWLVDVDDRRTPPTSSPVPPPPPVDTDGDGLSDVQEGTLGTNPQSPDTDLDGFTDGEEVASGHDPLSSVPIPEPSPAPQDPPPAEESAP